MGNICVAFSPLFTCRAAAVASLELDELDEDEDAAVPTPMRRPVREEREISRSEDGSEGWLSRRSLFAWRVQNFKIYTVCESDTCSTRFWIRLRRSGVVGLSRGAAGNHPPCCGPSSSANVTCDSFLRATLGKWEK